MFVFVILFLSIHRFTTTYLKFNISEQLCRFYSKNGRAFSAWPYPYFEQGYSFPWDKKTTNFFKIFNVQYWNKSADLKMRLLSIYRASYLTAHLVRRIYDELKKTDVIIATGMPEIDRTFQERQNCRKIHYLEKISTWSMAVLHF